MSRICDYVVVRLHDNAFRLDRVTEPFPGPVANITPIRDRAGTPTGWRLRPLFVMQGSKSKIWPTPAEVVASTKLMTPGQARAAVESADTGAPRTTSPACSPISPRLRPLFRPRPRR